ncbi:hypothetical protein BDN72DRAFT_750723, partial [Pluteus cervinus]
GAYREQLTVKIRLEREVQNKMFQVEGLIDSGATLSVIDRSFVKENEIDTIEIPIPIKVYNTDGSPNAVGEISERVVMGMWIGSHYEEFTFNVVDLG